MKLVLAVIDNRDIRAVRGAMIEDDYRFTELGSTGGFLRGGSTTLICGVEDERAEPLIALLAAHCRRREELVNVAGADTKVYSDSVGAPQLVVSGGAQVFVLTVERALSLE